MQKAGVMKFNMILFTIIFNSILFGQYTSEHTGAHIDSTITGTGYADEVFNFVGDVNVLGDLVTIQNSGFTNLLVESTGGGDGSVYLQTTEGTWQIKADRSQSNNLIFSVWDEYGGTPAGVKLTLDTDGNLGVSGDLDVGGDLTVNGAFNFATDTSTAAQPDIYDLVLSDLTSYTTIVAGTQVSWVATTANTGACNILVNALAQKDLFKMHNQELASGDIEVGQIVTAIYDGTQWQMTSQLAQ